MADRLAVSRVYTIQSILVY